MSGEDESQSVPETASPSNSARFKYYLLLNAAAWVFLAFQAVVIIIFLGTSRLVFLLTFFLAVGFAVVSVFDYFWLRYFR